MEILHFGNLFVHNVIFSHCYFVLFAQFYIFMLRDLHLMLYSSIRQVLMHRKSEVNDYEKLYS